MSTLSGTRLNLYRVLILSLISFTGFQAKATHFVGGDISVQRDVDPAYVTIILTLYRDEINAAAILPPNDLITIYSRNNLAAVQGIFISRTSIDTVPYLRPDCSMGILSTTRHTYVTTLHDSVFASLNHPSGYIFEFKRPARNNVISNIVNPGNIDFAVVTEVPRFFDGQDNRIINSSPVFINNLGDIACFFKQFDFDHSAIDADGDSLVYSLETPTRGILGGNFVPVVFTAGFSLTNMIPGAPSLQINPVSGEMTVRPTLMGLFAFVVKVREFRNGAFIGSVTKEFQLMVIDCGSSPNDFDPLIKVWDQKKQDFYQVGDTLELDSITGKCFQGLIIDEDNDSELTLKSTLLNGPQALLTPFFQSGTTNSFANPSDTARFTICLNVSRCLGVQDSIFRIRLSSNDKSCLGGRRRDTLELVVRLNLPPDTAARVVSLNTNRVGNVVRFTRGATPSFFIFVGFNPGEAIRLQLVEDSITQAFGFAPVNQASSIPYQFPYSWFSGCRGMDIYPDTFKVVFKVSDLECNVLSDTMPVFFVIDRANSIPSYMELIEPIPRDTVLIDQKHDFIVKVHSPLKRRVRLTLRYNVEVIQKLRVFFANDVLNDGELRWFSFTPRCNILESDSVKFRFTISEENGPCDRAFDSLDVVYYFKEINTPAFTRIINEKGEDINSTLLPHRTYAEYDVVGGDVDIFQTLTQKAWAENSARLPPWATFIPGSGKEDIIGKLQLNLSCELSRPGTYSLQLKTQDNSCKAAGDTAKLAVTIQPNESLEEIPNLLTPNGDGLNDFFSLSDFKGICDFEEFKIFNRWGRLVYQTQDPGFIWNAEEVPEGQYFYSLIASKNSFSGYISVLK